MRKKRHLDVHIEVSWIGSCVYLDEFLETGIPDGLLSSNTAAELCQTRAYMPISWERPPICIFHIVFWLADSLWCIQGERPFWRPKTSSSTFVVGIADNGTICWCVVVYSLFESWLFLDSLFSIAFLYTVYDGSRFTDSTVGEKATSVAARNIVPV